MTTDAPDGTDDSRAEDGGLRWAYALDEKGGARGLSWDQVKAADPADEPAWIHVDRTGLAVQDWVRNKIGIDPAIAEALLTGEPRPRCLAHEDGLLVVIRAVNLNPGAQPDDMLSLRMWITPARLISLRQRRLRATHDVAAELDAGKGPASVASLFVRLVQRVTARIEPVLDNLYDLADGLEERLDGPKSDRIRGELADLRQQIIAMRRYLAPQRAMLHRLLTEDVPWLEAVHRAHLREVADLTTRYVEDLEELRERGTVIHDELANRVAEQLNQRMYVLSLVAAIFLPLGLLTGLLGINVGGMPGAEDPVAFWIVCGVLVGLGAGLVVLFRNLRWL